MIKHRLVERLSLSLVLAVVGVSLVACGNSSGSATRSAGAAASGSTSIAMSGMAPYSGSDRILTSDTSSKSVSIDLVAAEGSAASGFNFNGYAKGAMAIEVPTGWSVKVIFTDASSTPHSALIVPWNERHAAIFHPAFTGSATPDYRSGIEKGDSAQSFSFTADKAGQYALVCGVPGHDDLGMWDSFDVIDNLAAPRVLVKQ